MQENANEGLGCELMGPFQGLINSLLSDGPGALPTARLRVHVQGAWPGNGNLPASTDEAPDVV
jgi:hypothetical protein